MTRNDKIIVVDIDGTLAQSRGAGQSYSDVAVVRECRDRLVALHEEGYHIVLFTSRNMKTHSGNVGLIIKHTAPVLLEWLARHDVPYDELHFGKPWCGTDGFYVDDRAVRPREFVTMSVEQIRSLLKRDRLPS